MYRDYLRKINGKENLAIDSGVMGYSTCLSINYEMETHSLHSKQIQVTVDFGQ